MPQEAQTRQLIVEAAQELFARFGLAKTTMADIARACGKGKSSLYYYFASKEQVFAAVIDKEVSGLKDSIARAVAKADTPREKLRAFTMARLIYLGQKADQYTAIKEEHLRHYGFIEDLTREYSHWELQFIQGILQNGLEQNHFRPLDPPKVARALFFALKGFEYPWITGMSQREMKRTVDVLLEVIFQGIAR